MNTNRYIIYPSLIRKTLLFQRSSFFPILFVYVLLPRGFSHRIQSLMSGGDHESCISVSVYLRLQLVYPFFFS